jgi:trk system potassium uptake protein TrkA
MIACQYTIVVGCGRLGSILANRLSRMGSNVVVVDREEAAFEKLSVEYSGFQVTGDAAELAILRRAGIERADCLLAATGHDNVNLMVAQVAKTVFGVSKVIARVADPSRQAVYDQLGIDTVCPTLLSADTFLATLCRRPEVPAS